MKKQKALYSGKAKTIYLTDDPDHFVLHYRDDATAFNGVKVAQLERKGMVNNNFNAFIMQKLKAAGVETHFEKLLGPQESLVKRLEMLPVECVVRNVVAGGLAKRLGVEEGTVLDKPIFEWFLKNDALNDPMINEYHIRSFGWATDADIEMMQTLTFKVNDVLKPLFEDAKLTLVDFKLEFGLYQGRLLLGDEFTPDGCRLWDIETGEKFDKDRFRRDMGDVIEFYEEAARRLGIEL